MELENILIELNALDYCQKQKEWAHEVNTELCGKGINWEFNSMTLLLLSIVSLFLLGTAVFLSENVIRGLFNEEIKYVKTNKQRYDWN